MKRFLSYLFILLFCPVVFVTSQSVVNSKHNLSVSGPGMVKASSETEICLFCHTPHTSRPKAPLWNRENPGSVYTLYNSSTLQAKPGQPDGSSILCLSCHDGTIALGNVLSRGEPISFGAVTTMPKGAANLSTDLRNDHPVSFIYSSALGAEDRQIKNPSTLSAPVVLEKSKLQCTSCHDPHKNTYENFLLASTQYSKLCLSCHQRTGWATSSHATSEKKLNGASTSALKDLQWGTVAQNGCQSCHSPHNSGSVARLLKYQIEENNCFSCHNSSVASKNVQAEFLKPYKHNVYAYSGIHDPAEEGTVVSKHVECADCHNPHASTNQAGKAPAVKGANMGVSGINQSGVAVNPAVYEYEICFRCHADYPATGATTPRAIIQNNTRLEFSPSNPSYHPVIAAGVNTGISGLIAPLTASSVIYCTDCHASNGNGASGAPHGSIYPQILKFNYDRSSGYVNTYSAYELCYQCHEQDVTISRHQLLGKSHGTMTSCNTCHDPHGISGTQGNSKNNRFLMNFNLNVVAANSRRIMQWSYISPGRGSCNLKCHGKDHIDSEY